MAADDERAKARLLLDHGAELNAIDDEYRSTPLGIAARWGRMRMVKLFLERGTDPTAAGAPWATPLAWAEKKGHEKIAKVLRAAESKDSR
jgi:ankyrin repeat protein